MACAVGLTTFCLINKSEAASFDCKKAGTIVESLICIDPELSQLDDKMAVSYFGALSHVEPQSQSAQLLQASQRNWLRRRDQCQTETCVSQSYLQRLTELDSAQQTIFANPNAPTVVPFSAAPQVIPAAPAQEQVDRRGWVAWVKAYWETTGIGGIFMALGGLFLFLGAGSIITTPERIETKSGGSGIILRTRYPGYVPSASDIRRGRKQLLFGAIVALFGACLTYGPTTVWNTIHKVYLNATEN